MVTHRSDSGHSSQPGLFSTGDSRIQRLCDLEPGETGDCFVLLVSREKSSTRDGKPYYRALFKDASRTVTAMIWSDSGCFADCEHNWKPGNFYKIRCRYEESQYGPQIDIDRIREVNDEDTTDGFDPTEFLASSRFVAEEMFVELLQIVDKQIENAGLKKLVVKLLTDNAQQIQRSPAATKNHHAFIGGYLEHVLSVTQTAVFLADKYRLLYPEMHPPLSKSLVVAGAVLHDIGKLQELAVAPHGAEYTAAGRLIGHILLGRDIVREAATEIPELEPELLLRLEHIIVSHQNLPEWGSPIAPHTPEALLVHYSDDIDAKFQMMADALTAAADDENAEFTSRSNPLRRAIFRGLKPDEAPE